MKELIQIQAAFISFPLRVPGECPAFSFLTYLFLTYLCPEICLQTAFAGGFLACPFCSRKGEPGKWLSWQGIVLWVIWESLNGGGDGFIGSHRKPPLPWWCRWGGFLFYETVKRRDVYNTINLNDRREAAKFIIIETFEVYNIINLIIAL